MSFWILLLSPLAIVNIPLLAMILKALKSADRESFYEHLEYATALNLIWVPFGLIVYSLYPSIMSWGLLGSFLMSLATYLLTLSFAVSVTKLVEWFHLLRERILEIRGRDPRRVRSRILKIDRDIADIAYRMRELECAVKDMRVASQRHSDVLNRLGSTFENLQNRVQGLSENQDKQKVLLESLTARMQSMIDPTELHRKVMALEEICAEVVSLLEQPPTRLLSRGFRKVARK
jgi:chaperonin cofactor prefoldin